MPGLYRSGPMGKRGQGNRNLSERKRMRMGTGSGMGRWWHGTSMGRCPRRWMQNRFGRQSGNLGAAGNDPMDDRDTLVNRIAALEQQLDRLQNERQQ